MDDMSTDNWGTCPKCGGVDSEEWERDKKKLEESYGKIPADEYLDLLAAFLAAFTEEPDEVETLREDYELGILDGEFYVIYHAGCTKCGFKYEFKHSARYPWRIV